MKTVILGYGYMGEIRHRVADELEGLETVAVVDPARAGASARRLVVEEDFSAILDREKPEVVFVCTPNHLIPQFCCQALDAGCHVFCEKPPGRNVADIELMREAEKKAEGRKLMFGFNHRHHPAVQDAKNICESEELGRLMWIRGVYGKSGGAGRGFEESWRNNPEISGGGILIDQGIHMLDLFRYFVGEFEEVEGILTTSYWNIPVEDNAFVHLRGTNGMMAQLHSSATLWKHTFQMDLGCEEGYLSVRGLLSKSGSYGRETLIIGRKPTEGGRGVVGIPPEETIYYDHDPSWHVQVEEFVRCIREDSPVTDSTSLDALKVMELVARVYAEERPHKIGEFSPSPRAVTALHSTQRTVVVEPEVHEDDIRPDAPTAEFRRILNAEAAVVYEDEEALIETDCPVCSARESWDLFGVSGARYASCVDCGTWYVKGRPGDEALQTWRSNGKAMAFWHDSILPPTRDNRMDQVFMPRAMWIRRTLELAARPLKVSSLVDLDPMLKEALQSLGVALDQDSGAVLWLDRLDRASRPRRELQHLVEQMVSGQLLMANAWLCSGYDISLLQEKHPALNPLERLNLPTEKGLRCLVADMGCDVVEFSTPGVLDLKTVRRCGGKDLSHPGSFADLLMQEDNGDRDHEFTEFLQKNHLSSYGRIVLRKN